MPKGGITKPDVTDLHVLRTTEAVAEGTYGGHALQSPSPAGLSSI